MAADATPSLSHPDGPFTLAGLAEGRALLAALGAGHDLDLSGQTRIDTAGAWLIATAQAAGLSVTGETPAQRLLLTTVAAALPAKRMPRRVRLHNHTVDILAGLGQRVAAMAGSGNESLGFLGLVMARFVQAIFRPSRFRLTALFHHMQDAGLAAVPIVVLMGFLIGLVLAFQGASQLKTFGAEVFVVNLIAISMLRELGILLTAIIVAGRSASAFTAAIGSMKMREEVDAMRVLGLDPIDLLVLPRVLALVIWLPLLGFLANMAGLLGGGLMAWLSLGISPGQFRTQLLADTDVSQLLVGLSKAPVFAVIIGVVGCHQGMQVKGDTESLG